MKNKIKNKLMHIIPALIVMTIMIIIFKMKNMYPFGEKMTVQIDADFNYVPALFKIHDIFHYGDSLIWDFKIGGGANIYGALVMHSIYSPLNWLVILIKRDNIRNFFNILLIIKFMAMATTMFIFIRKNFKKVDTFWQILLSIIYVFSGWGLLMYSNIFYIDTIILFPLVMHYYLKIFKENKNLGLIITLSYSLILNPYLTYMIYLFIIFSSLLANLLLIEKEKRKEIIINISFSLVLPLFIAAFAYLPTVAQILESNRITSHSYGPYFYYFLLKITYIMMCPLIIQFTIKFIKQTKKKEKIFYIILILMTTIGVIIEPINRAWHTGNYYSFPYRYSFITIFIMICYSSKYLTNNTQKSLLKDKNILFIIITCMILIILFMANSNYIFERVMIGFDIQNMVIVLIISTISILYSLAQMYAFKLKNNKQKKIVITILIISQILIYCNWVFNDYKYKESARTLEYEKELKIEDETLYKYIDYEGKIGINSSYITRNATISNWLHFIPSKQLEFTKKLGYLNISTRIYGPGGTVFSDTIIGTKYVYSEKELPESAYKLIKEFESDDRKINVYELRNNISFGILHNNIIEKTNIESTLETQNYYYKNLFDTEEDIVKKIKLTKENDKYISKIKLNEEIILYLEMDEKLSEQEIKEVNINNEKIKFANENGIVYLGSYDSDINIEIAIEETNIEKIKFGYIKTKDFIEMTKRMNVQYNTFEFDKNKLHINIDSNKEQYLFLPINNIKGWTGTLNNKKIKIEDELYTFMSIKIEKGNNDIKLEYNPPYLKEGIKISLLGLIILIVYTKFKEKINRIKILKDSVNVLYYVIAFAIVIFVYIISNFIFI